MPCQFNDLSVRATLGPSGTRPETLLVRTSPCFCEIFDFRPSETLPISPSCSRFVSSRVSYFPIPRSHVSDRSFVFPHRAGPGRLHLPNPDARVTCLLRWRTDMRSVAFPSPCSVWMIHGVHDFPCAVVTQHPVSKVYIIPVVATLKSQQPLFSPLAISVSPLLASILALALVVSLALITVVHGLYVVVTTVQVTSIVVYVVISYIVLLLLVALVLALVFLSSYTLVVGTLSFVNAVSLVTNVLATILVATLFDIVDVPLEAPVLVIKAFPSSLPSLSRAA
jgi:hypothetical protein